MSNTVPHTYKKRKLFNYDLGLKHAVQEDHFVGISIKKECNESYIKQVKQLGSYTLQISLINDMGKEMSANKLCS